MAILFVPTPLRKVTNGNSKVELNATTIAELIESAEKNYPGFRERVMENGEFKRFINVFVNGMDIRNLQGKATAIKDGDEISVIPAMAGGCNASRISVQPRANSLFQNKELRKN